MKSENEAVGSGARWAARMAIGGVLLAALVAIGAFVQSCGQQKSGSAGVEPRSGGVTAEPAAQATPPAAAAGAIQAPGGQASQETSESQGVPPDVAVAAVDTLVSPGAAIEIGFHATPDVTEMALSDGSGEPQAFYHDPASDTWKVSYRVPLRPKTERLALSVTAKNDEHRWRRVWLFLHVANPAEEEKAAADSTTR